MRVSLSIRIACVALMLLLCFAESPVASGQEANSAKAQVTPDEVASYLGTPVLAALPKNGK